MDLPDLLRSHEPLNGGNMQEDFDYNAKRLKLQTCGSAGTHLPSSFDIFVSMDRWLQQYFRWRLKCSHRRPSGF